MKFKTIVISRNRAIKSELSCLHIFFLKKIKSNKNKQMILVTISPDYRGFVIIPLNEGPERKRQYLMFWAFFFFFLVPAANVVPGT